MNVLPGYFSSRRAPSAWLRALTAALSFHRVGARTTMWYEEFRDHEQDYGMHP